MHFPTLLLAIITSLTLTLAHPLPNISTSNTTSCIAQQWSIIGFTAYTAPAGPLAPGTPSIFNASRLSFRFSDPNTNTMTVCTRRLEAGKGGTVADPYSQFDCEDASVRYMFDGEVLVVGHTFGCLGKNVTAYGSIQGNVNCQERFGGEQCTTAVTEVTVVAEFLHH